MANLPNTLGVEKELEKLKNDRGVGYTTFSTKETTTLETENDLRTRGSALLQKMDFFNLYGIPEYKPSQDNSEDNYLGFMPIIIRNASFYGNEVGEKTSIDFEDGKNFKIDIKLPWLPSEISDSVSVSYSRRGNTGVQWPEAIAKFVANYLSGDLANIVLVEYNAQNLSKTLDLEFILPINRTFLTAGGTHYTIDKLDNTRQFREENIEVKDFMKNVRAYLGALQGLVYPRAFGFLYPPLLSVKLGGLYRGFKGFLREVSIRTSEEMLDLGNEMFPMIIRGSLRFINVFMYSWSDTHHEIARTFVLSDNPQILFGMDYKDEDLITSVSAGENIPNTTPTIINNLDIQPINIGEQNITAIQRAYDRYKNFNYNDINYENLNRVYQNMKNFDVNQNFNLLDFDPEIIRSIDFDYANIISSIDNDQFNFLGIDSNNESLLLSKEIQNKIGSVQDISNYVNLLENIRENDLYSSLTSLSRILNSSSSTISDSVNTVVDLYWPIVNILSTIDSGISLSNITEFYSNILALISVLENSSLMNKSDLNEAVYTNNLYIEKSSNTLNEINKSLNSNISQYNDLAPVTTLYFSNLMLLETEILKNLNHLKNINQLIYEAAYNLKSKNILTENEVIKYKSAYDQAKKIDTIFANNINELLYTNLNTINGVL